MKTKTCRFCNAELTEENKQKGKGIGNACKPCYREVRRKYSAKRRKEKAEYMREHRRKHTVKIKLETMQHYSGSEEPKCARCSYSDMRALSIDHINGNGSKHRGELGLKRQNQGGGGEKFYRWLRRQEYPEGYQVLCMNCQFVKMQENKENCHYQ